MINLHYSTNSLYFARKAWIIEWYCV